MQVTVDGFLGGRLRLAQPGTGYRAGIDPVLLAAACPAQTGQEVLELGCGVGVASLCLGWRVPGLALSGVEIMGDYAQIARENAARNDIEFDVRQGDVSARPTPFYDRSFHHVIMNPPYFCGRIVFYIARYRARFGAFGTCGLVPLGGHGRQTTAAKRIFDRYSKGGAFAGSLGRA